MTRHILALVLALTLFPTLAAGQSPETSQALDDLERMIQQSLAQVGVVRQTVTPPPPVDCQVSDWQPVGDWTDLSPTLQTLTYVRVVVVQPVGTGAVCPVLTKTETRPTPPPPIPIVKTAAEITAALAKGGDIQLAPSDTCYKGNWTFTVPNTRLLGLELPVGFGRVLEGATTQYALCALDTFRPVVHFAASKTALIGIRVWAARNDREPVTGGSSTATDPLTVPDDVLMQQVEVLTTPEMGGKRGIQMNTRKFTLIDSQVLGFWYAGADSQAFFAANGPGPYNLVNNKLSATGENALIGGATTRSAAMHPKNAVIRNNWFYKPEEWRGTAKGSSVKNLLEFKAMDGAIVEGNLFDGNWPAAQSGSAILLTPRASGSGPFIVVRNIEIRNNVMRRHAAGGYAVNIMGDDNTAPTLMTENVTIEGNLFEDSVKFIQLGRGMNGTLTVRNNTTPAVKWNMLNFDAVATAPKPVLVFTNNVSTLGEYGVSGSGTSLGTPSLIAWTTSYTFTGNVLEQPASRTIPLPAGNTILAAGVLKTKLDPITFKYLLGGAGY